MFTHLLLAVYTPVCGTYDGLQWRCQPLPTTCFVPKLWRKKSSITRGRVRPRHQWATSNVVGLAEIEQDAQHELYISQATSDHYTNTCFIFHLQYTMIEFTNIVHSLLDIDAKNQTHPLGWGNWSPIQKQVFPIKFTSLYKIAISMENIGQMSTPSNLIHVCFNACSNCQ